MAKDRSTTAETTTSHTSTTERNAFKEGQPVEYDGKLAKVVKFGFLELPTNPGQDAAFSDTLVATLQLPALLPGGKPEYAFNVDPSAITSLQDNPKRLRELQREFNPLFGEPAPAEPSKNENAPEVRQKGAAPKAERVSSTRGTEAGVSTAPPSEDAADEKKAAKRSSKKAAK